MTYEGNGVKFLRKGSYASAYYAIDQENARRQGWHHFPNHIRDQNVFLWEIRAEEREGVDQKDNKNDIKQEGERSVKKMMSLTQFLLCKFFMILGRAIRKAQSTAYQCTWDNYITFVNMGSWYIQVYLKMQLSLKMWFSTSFDLMRYAESEIYTKKSSFLSHSIFFFSKPHRAGDRGKLTK